MQLYHHSLGSRGFNLWQIFDSLAGGLRFRNVGPTSRFCFSGSRENYGMCGERLVWAKEYRMQLL